MVQTDLLLVILLFPGVNLIGVEFTCPIFKDGHNIVSCKINKTAVEAADCLSLQSYVTLEKTTTSRRNPLVIGFTQPFNLSNCKPVQEPVANSCWCDESNGEIFDYKCDFVANRSKDIDAMLQCKICIKPKNPLEEKVHDNCNRTRFGGSSDVGPGSGGSSNVGLIVGAILAAVVLLVLLIAAIVVVRRHRCEMCGKYIRAPFIKT